MLERTRDELPLDYLSFVENLPTAAALYKKRGLFYGNARFTNLFEDGEEAPRQLANLTMLSLRGGVYSVEVAEAHYVHDGQELCLALFSLDENSRGNYSRDEDIMADYDGIQNRQAGLNHFNSLLGLKGQLSVIGFRLIASDPGDYGELLAIIKAGIRRTDVLSHLGDDLHMLVLPGCDLKVAESIIGTIEKKVELGSVAKGGEPASLLYRIEYIETPAAGADELIAEFAFLS